jgi:hypothetical protein
MTRRDRTVFVSLLVLSSDRSIHVLYPSGGAVGAAIELKARTARPIGFRRGQHPTCLKSTRDHF